MVLFLRNHRSFLKYSLGGIIKAGLDTVKKEEAVGFNSQAQLTSQIEDKTAKKDILDVLIEKKLLISDQANEIREKAEKTDKSTDEVLETSEIIPERTLVKAYAILYNLPFVNLGDYHIPQGVVNKIPEEMARKEYIIPFEAQGNMIKVAVAKPYRLKKGKTGIISKYKEREKVDVKLYLATIKDVEEAFKYYHQAPRQQITVQDHFAKTVTPPKQVLRNILDVLLAQKAIDQKKYKIVHDKAVEQHKTYEQILREQKIVSSEKLAKSLGFLYRLPFISLKNVDIPYQVLIKFPVNIATEYNMIVFDAIGNNVLKVVTSSPENKQIKEIINFIRRRNNIEVDLFVTTPEDIVKALTGYQKAPTKQVVERPAVAKLSTPQVSTKTQTSPVKPKEISPAPKITPEEEKPIDEIGKADVQAAIGEIDLGKLLRGDISSIDQLKQIIGQGLVPKIVAAMINFALKRKASDIHIEPADNKIRLRYRIDGVLRDIALIPLSLHPAIVSRIKISAHLRIDEQRVPQDGRFDVAFKDRVVDIRVSTLPTVKGEKVVMRLLDKSKGIISLEKLGLTGEPYKKVIKNIKKPYGMILSTGPTGSGKTTTLYAAMQFINNSEVNIVTLEDPVEYEIEGINHCQARPEIGFSFAEGLRSILRQDPNVIMIGEIRDKETAGMAVHAALTGHLVLSTLHTNDAGGAVPRLIDMGVEPFLITSSTNLVMAQRLARKICPHCKEKITLPPAVLKEVEGELAKIPEKANVEIRRPMQFYRGRGCPQCNNGYSGRVGIFEVLEMTPTLDRIAIKKVSGSAITKAAVEEGMITMKQDGILKALAGITSIDEIFRVTLVSE